MPYAEVHLSVSFYHDQHVRPRSRCECDLLEMNNACFTSLSPWCLELPVREELLLIFAHHPECYTYSEFTQQYYCCGGVCYLCVAQMRTCSTSIHVFFLTCAVLALFLIIHSTNTSIDDIYFSHMAKVDAKIDNYHYD